MGALPTLPVLCEGKPLVTGVFPSQRSCGAELCFLGCYSEQPVEQIVWLPWFGTPKRWYHVTVMNKNPWTSNIYLRLGKNSREFWYCCNADPCRKTLAGGGPYGRLMVRSFAYVKCRLAMNNIQNGLAKVNVVSSPFGIYHRCLLWNVLNNIYWLYWKTPMKNFAPAINSLMPGDFWKCIQVMVSIVTLDTLVLQHKAMRTQNVDSICIL